MRGAARRGRGLRLNVVEATALVADALCEANPRLRFDRAAPYGMHLAVTAGAAVRFEPGGTRRVPLVPIGGRRVIIGFAGDEFRTGFHVEGCGGGHAPNVLELAGRPGGRRHLLDQPHAAVRPGRGGRMQPAGHRDRLRAGHGPGR